MAKRKNISIVIPCSSMLPYLRFLTIAAPVEYIIPHDQISRQPHIRSKYGLSEQEYILRHKSSISDRYIS